MRKAEIKRKTKETEIVCSVDLDGKGVNRIDTGVGFFDHMLTALSKHSFIDIELTCDGDLEVDTHHTVEDCGIVLGETLRKALGDMSGIARYGSFIMPMDEALILCSVDLGGRGFYSGHMEYTTEKIGDLDTQMIDEFFRSFADNAKINLHIREITGINDHHICEGAYKALAKALSQAVAKDPRIEGVLSTKGTL